jgi:hypothetical protein
MSSLVGNPNSIKQGDTKPLVATLTDAKGPVNLAGCSVQFRMKSRVAGQGHAPIAGACTVLQYVDVDSGRIKERGQVQYDWGVGQTDVPGLYGLEFDVTFPDATTQTFPNDRTTTFEIQPAAA